MFSVAHIDTGSTYRGGQEALLGLARALRARGLTQHIVCPADSPLAERAQREKFTISPPGSVSKLRGLLRDFDIVHAHSGRAQTLAFFATAGLTIRRVATRHVAFEPRHPGIHRLKYTLTCHGIIAVSKAARQTLLDAGVPADKIEIIPTGVEWPSTLPDAAIRRAARCKWGLAESDFVVGHMGAFTHEKGQDVAIAAAALLEHRLPRLKMLLAGEGPLRDSLRPGGLVSLPGYVEDRPGFLAALDLFIMPSRSEAWGLAALEAMAHGVPVVASDAGGLSEIVESGQTGWLVPPGDAHALAHAIEEAASSPETLRERGRKARDAARRFSLEETAARTEAFYRRLLS